MRFSFVPFVVLAATFSLANAQNKIDATLKPPPPPTSVNVVNFPDVQAVGGTVSVDNLPAVQAVGGTVAVSNLPAVQTVGGMVNVGNLPLDADGAVRVSNASARQMVRFELLDSPSEHVQDYTLPVTVDTTGYSSVGLTVTTMPSGSDVVYKMLRSWSGDDPFEQILDYRSAVVPGNPCDFGHLGSLKLLCPVTGGSVQVTVSASAGVVFTSVKLYLFP